VLEQRGLSVQPEELPQELQSEELQFQVPRSQVLALQPAPQPAAVTAVPEERESSSFRRSEPEPEAHARPVQTHPTSERLSRWFAVSTGALD
jgi:hypothetical protein